MTPSEIRAMQRAIAERIQVVCCIYDGAANMTAFVVADSDGAHPRQVTEHGPGDFECDCRMYQRNHTCRHTAAVTLHGHDAPYLAFV